MPAKAHRVPSGDQLQHKLAGVTAIVRHVIGKLDADPPLVRAEAFEPPTAEGTIKLCASDYLQHALIIPLIRALRRHAPKLKVLVAPRQASGLADLMARGEIDLYVSNREVADPALPSLLLYRDRYICVARRRHPLRGGASRPNSCPHSITC